MMPRSQSEWLTISPHPVDLLLSALGTNRTRIHRLEGGHPIRWMTRAWYSERDSNPCATSCKNAALPLSYLSLLGDPGGTRTHGGNYPLH